MLLLGLIKEEDPTLLIDPVSFESVEALYTYLTTLLNSQKFSLTEPLTLDLLQDGLTYEKPLIINFGESSVSLMLGEQEVIYANTSRFVHVGLLDELKNL
jgi:hypothetical protein